jgi:putative transposase
VPPRPTAGSAGIIFHVLNRGVRKWRLFETERDYRAFLDVVVAAMARYSVEIFAYCVMPNHFHFVIAPTSDGQLSAFMWWMTGTHSKRWHKHRGTNGTGAVYQGRYKAFPVQDDLHFLSVCRYVERNALRAGLVRRADEWPWSSAHQRSFDCQWIPLTPWRLPRPDDWVSLLNSDDPQTDAIRRCVIRSRPFGSPNWAGQVAGTLSLAKSLPALGRPTTTSGSFLRRT